MATEKPHEEEISLSGRQIKSEKTVQETVSEKEIDARHANLESIATPGMTDAQLVDAVLSAPTESLIPWETVKLPSKGIYYGWSTPYIEVRAMGQAAEKALANQRLAQSGESIDYMFRECCRFPNDYDSLDLLVGDRIFLLYYIRGITHGNLYEFAVTCQNPDCQHVSTHEYDLNELANTIIWADENLGSEPFKISLPYMSDSLKRDFWVELRFMRGRDTNSMLNKRRNKKKFAVPPVRTGRGLPRQRQELSLDDTLSENLDMVIQSVMGVKDHDKIQQFVRKMHATDTATIRTWLRDNSPGMDVTVSITCVECNTEMTIAMPVSESFFRPTPKRS